MATTKRVSIYGIHAEFASTEHQTLVWAEDGDLLFTLQASATENEVLAALYGYIAGRAHGRLQGASTVQNKIRHALGL